MDRCQERVFDRRCLPEMDLASAACAIRNVWLRACAEGLGTGWVSIFEHDVLRALLHMPAGARPIAFVCLDHLSAFYPKPMLEQEGCATRQSLADLLFQDRWDNPAAASGADR